MPSSASEVNATFSFTSAQWQQAPAPAQQETDSQPFAALLDANSTAPEAMPAPANPSQPGPAQTTAPQPSLAVGATWQGHVSNPNAGGSASSNASAAASTTPAEKLAVAATNGSEAAPADAGQTVTAPVTGGGQKNAAQWLIRHLNLKGITGGNSAAAPSQGTGNASAQATGTGDASATAAPGDKQTAKPQSTNSLAADANPAAIANDPALDPNAVSADIAASAAASAVAGRPSAAPAAGSETPQDDGKDAAGNGGDTDTADGLSQSQPAANAAQPIAGVIFVNAPVSTPPAPSATVNASAAIGQSSKGRANATATATADQDVSKTPDVADAKAPKQAHPGAQTQGAANAAPSPSADGNAAADPAAAQSGSTQATGENPAPQSGGAGSADINHAAAQPADLSSAASLGSGTGSPTIQNGTGTAKSSADGLPNFGFSLSVAASPNSAPTAPAGAPPAPAVPIAGLAVVIAARAQAGSNQFDIRLDPPELGRIDVRLDVDRNGLVTTHMTADRADTLNLLQSQQPQLEQALQQAGLKTADNGLQFSLRDQSFAGQQNGNGSGSQPGNSAQLVIPDADLTPIVATQIYSRLGRGSGVDIRV